LGAAAIWDRRPRLTRMRRRVGKRDAVGLMSSYVVRAAPEQWQALQEAP
jgi:hypothetical protein